MHFTFLNSGVLQQSDLMILIREIVEKARKNNSIKVAAVQCSHFHLIDVNNNNGGHIPSGVSHIVREMFQIQQIKALRRIPTMLNHSAIAIAFTSEDIREFYNISQLPKAAYLCLLQDKQRLHQFCSRTDTNPRIPVERTQDDNALNLTEINDRPVFRDDGYL